MYVFNEKYYCVELSDIKKKSVRQLFQIDN